MLRGVLRPALALTALLCALTGFLYPAVVTGLAQLLFAHQANGSLVTAQGRVVGSALVGQQFTRPEYFHPRPSAAGDDGYDAASSGATNLGPTDSTLVALLVARADSAVAAGAVRGAVPSDLVTASGSGLDPHISPAHARLQVARVAAARGVDTAAVQRVLDANTEGRLLGLLGEPRVNVLLLNVALDSAFTRGEAGRFGTGQPLP